MDRGYLSHVVHVLGKLGFIGPVLEHCKVYALLREFNPYHEPEGSSKGGQFTFAPAGSGVGVAGNDPDNPHNAPVSTRVPTEKVRSGPERGKQIVWPPGAHDVHESPDILSVGIDSSKGDAENFHKNMNIIRKYDFLKIDKGDDDNTVADKFIAFAKSNVLALYDSTDKAVAKLSKRWYDGAHSYADKLGADHGVPLRVAAGVIASLSPQKDWDMNADMARRVMNMWQNRKRETFTEQTAAYAREYLAKLKASADNAGTEAQRKSRLADWELMSGWVKDFQGKSLGDFDSDPTPQKQATFMRWIDEGKNLADPSRANYRVFHPGGVTGDVARNNPTKKQAAAGLQGDPGKIAWQTYGSIDSAIDCLKYRTRKGISKALGEKHKVRSFYNNIMYPNDPAGHVTIDTHAIAAAAMHPYAGKDVEVAQGLGGAGSKSVVTGAKGLYGLYAEAYRQAAAERHLLPRQMQSVVWETIRGVWSSEDKNPQEVARVASIWKDYKDGKIDQSTAQRRVIEKGIANPLWYKRSSESYDSARPSVDTGILHDRGLSRYRPEGLDGGNAGGYSAHIAMGRS